MASTSFTTIYDMFMMQLTDYRLINLFNSSPADFSTYLLGFMLLALPDFSSICTQNLNDNDGSSTFNFAMTQENINVLSKLMLQQWLGKEVRDILQMRWTITDRDFKHYAEANNLNAKLSALNMLKEEISQTLSNYSYLHNNWSSWAAQNFV